MKYNCIIVGGGPCGVSSAIYLKRAGYSVAIIEKSFIGGQVAYSTELSNYAGFIEKDTFIFCQNLTKQLKELEIPTITAEVTKINEIQNEEYEIVTTKGNYLCSACILSIGAESRKLNIADEKKYANCGVSYCAICDGNLYRNKNVLVIGGGNSAFEDAIYLSRICNKVYLANRSECFRAEAGLQISLQEIQNSSPNKVEIITNANLVAISGENCVEKAILTINNTQKEVDVNGIFIAIGREPNTTFLENFITLTGKYIEVNENFETSRKGIFAGGDCIVKKVRQVVTAVSDGAIIAKNVTDFLHNKK